MKEYNTKEIEQMIESGESVVIDFKAPWCQPCKSFAPIFEKVSNEEEFNKFKFITVDVDNSADLSIKYGIKAIPTILLFENGAIKSKKTGAMSESLFKSFLNDNLAS